MTVNTVDLENVDRPRLVSDRGVGERDGVGTIDDRVEVMYEMQVVEVFALTDARACILAAGEVTTTSVE